METGHVEGAHTPHVGRDDVPSRAGELVVIEVEVDRVDGAGAVVGGAGIGWVQVLRLGDHAAVVLAVLPGRTISGPVAVALDRITPSAVAGLTCRTVGVVATELALTVHAELTVVAVLVVLAVGVLGPAGRPEYHHTEGEPPQNHPSLGYHRHPATAAGPRCQCRRGLEGVVPVCSAGATSPPSLAARRRIRLDYRPRRGLRSINPSPALLGDCHENLASHCSTLCPVSRNGRLWRR